MQLRQLVDPSLIFTDIVSSDRDSVLRTLAEHLRSRGLIRDADDLYRKLLERESLGSTAIGRGVAIPHCKLANLERVLVAVGVARDGVAIESPDQEPVKIFFLVVSPEGSPAEHLQTLAAISKWLKGTRNLDHLRRARTTDEVCASLRSDEGGKGG